MVQLSVAVTRTLYAVLTLARWFHPENRAASFPFLTLGSKNLTLLFLLASIPSPASHASPAPRYDLHCTIVPEKRLLAIAGEVTVPAELQTRDTLYFRLAEQMRDLEMKVVAPAPLAGAVVLTQIGTGNGTRCWSVRLPKPLPKGQPLTLYFACHGGEKTAFVFHIGTDGSYAGGTNTFWYPQFGTLDSRDGKNSVASDGNALGALRFVVPHGLIVMASGKQMGMETAGSEDTVTFQISQPTTFSFAANHFIVKRRQGRFPIALYLLKDRPDSEQFLDGIVQVVADLKKIYGPFPYPEFALGEVTDASTVGAGFGGVGFGGSMLATTSFLEKGFNLAFFGHEIGHQWWGNLVTVAGDKGAYFMEEGLAQYGSLVCVDRIAGASAAARYRREGYPGYIETQCGNGYLDLHAAGWDHILEEAGSDSGLAHELSDNKGFLVWNMLAEEIGAKRLHAALQDITRQYAFGQVTYDAFLAAIERRAGKPLDWFWAQWLRRTGAPNLDQAWAQSDSTLRLTIRQSEPIYRLHVPVRVLYDDGTATALSICSDSASVQWSLRAEKRVATVELDPDFRLLHYTPFTYARALAFKDLTTARWHLRYSRIAEAQAAFQKVLASSQQPDPYGLEFEVHLAKARNALVMANDAATARREAEEALRCTVRPPLHLARAYKLLLQVAITLEDKELGQWAARSLLVQEKSLSRETVYSRDARHYLDSQ